MRPVPNGQSFDTNTYIQLSKIRRGCFMTAPRTFAKDLSFASSKSTSTTRPIARYVIFKTCHLVEGWKFRGLEAWPLRLSPLCTTASPVARRGVPFSVAVGGLSLRACTLCSPFSGARQRPHSPKRGVRSPPCSYRPPGRTCALRARTARPLRRLLCVSLWFFVFFVSAAQREACPNFQASKLPFKICDSVKIPRAARPKGAMEPAGFPRQTVFAKKLPRTVLGCTRR